MQSRNSACGLGETWGQHSFQRLSSEVSITSLEEKLNENRVWLLRHSEAYGANAKYIVEHHITVLLKLCGIFQILLLFKGF